MKYYVVKLANDGAVLSFLYGTIRETLKSKYWKYELLQLNFICLVLCIATWEWVTCPKNVSQMSIQWSWMNWIVKFLRSVWKQNVSMCPRVSMRVHVCPHVYMYYAVLHSLYTHFLRGHITPPCYYRCMLKVIQQNKQKETCTSQV